jgi:hypothetical protein
MASDKVALLAQADPDDFGPAQLILVVIYLAVVIVWLVGLWKTFEKAGEPGWGAIVPIYNIYLMCKIARRPGWWVLLYFIPCVHVIIAIIVPLDIAKNFGKGTLFGIGLAFLGFIFFPILGFGDARYLGKKAQKTVRTGPQDPDF